MLWNLFFLSRDPYHNPEAGERAQEEKYGVHRREMQMPVP